MDTEERFRKQRDNLAMQTPSRRDTSMNTQTKILLTAADAAKALSISARSLWTLTHRGEIPCVRIGRSVRYSVADLQAWVASLSDKADPSVAGSFEA